MFDDLLLRDACEKRGDAVNEDGRTAGGDRAKVTTDFDKYRYEHFSTLADQQIWHLVAPGRYVLRLVRP